MSVPFGKTTAPVAESTVAPASSVRCIALVIVWSKSEPHRAGEIAFFPYDEKLYVGRGDVEIEKFASFLRHMPGEILAVDPHAVLLAGDSISRRQAQGRSTGAALEIEQVGRCPMFVNGVEKTSAVLEPGDTVLFKGELLLLCVLRPRELPRPHGWVELPAFGEADRNGIVGQSFEAWLMRARLMLIAAEDDDVLIQGQTGTGKELFAAAIHRESPRARGPYVSANAAAIPPELVAAEVFGNMKGYPEARMEAREGLVGAANGGTLFLDEIGELPQKAQAALLRVMDPGEYLRVGESKPRRVDVRVVGATNQDSSVFRKDFHARFALPVRLPPLCERREDIPLLVRHTLVERARKSKALADRFFVESPGGRLEPRMSARLIDHLVRSPLPRNVREVRTVLLASIHESPGDKLTLSSAMAEPPSLLPEPRVQTSTDQAEDDARKEEIERSIDEKDGNISAAAQALGMSRGALYRLIEKYGIERDPKPPKK